MTDIVEQGRTFIVGDEYRMRQLLCDEIERLRRRLDDAMAESDISDALLKAAEADRNAAGATMLEACARTAAAEAACVVLRDALVKMLDAYGVNGTGSDRVAAHKKALLVLAASSAVAAAEEVSK